MDKIGFLFALICLAALIIQVLIRIRDARRMQKEIDDRDREIARLHFKLIDSRRPWRTEDDLFGNIDLH